MNLYRWVKGLGLEPRVLGNVKGLQDPYRNPDDAEGLRRAVGPERRRWSRPSPTARRSASSRRSPRTPPASRSLQRGMSRGLEYRGDVMEIGALYDVEQLRELGGIVDYVGRDAADEGLLPRRARRIPSSATTSSSTRWARGRSIRSSSRTTWCISRCRSPSRASSLFGDSVAQPLGGALRRGLCRREARPRGGRDARRLRHVHDLRRGRIDATRCRERRYLPEGLVEGCTMRRRHRAGRGPRIRRRRLARGTNRRPSAGGAVGAIQAARPGSPSCSAPTHLSRRVKHLLSEGLGLSERA